MPFLLTFLASISTLLGSFFIYFDKNKKIIIFALSFAAGVMVMVSIIDLIPEAFKLFNSSFSLLLCTIYILIFINIGIIISMLIDKYLPVDNELYKVGIVSMAAIIMHNIPEGIATFITSSNNIKLGITLVIAIAAHNIPEGITIALPIYYSTNSRKKALLYTLISGLSEFFGSILAFLFLKPFVNNITLGILFSIIAGIMIHISFYELLPATIKFKNNKITLFSFIAGCLFIIFNLILFH